MPTTPSEPSGQTVIAGAYGVGNLGDEAILAGLLTEYGNEQVQVFSRFPPETQALHRVQAARKNLRDVLRARRLVVGGGELFQPNMAWKYGTLILVARALGKPVDVRAVGVSRGLKGWEKRLTRAALSRASSVRVRDAASAGVVRGWSVPVAVETDPSEKLSPRESEPIVKFLEGIKQRPLIGLNLRRTYRPERDAEVFSAVEAFVERLLQEAPEAALVYLPFTEHRDRAEERDVELGQALADRFGERVRIFRDRVHPSEMMGLVARLDGVVSMRFHPVVFADHVGTPVVALREYWKVEEFAKEKDIPVVESDRLAESVPWILERFSRQAPPL